MDAFCCLRMENLLVNINVIICNIVMVLIEYAANMLAMMARALQEISVFVQSLSNHYSLS